MTKPVWVVTFRTESADNYVEVFNEKPTDEQLCAYVKEVYPDEIDEEENVRYIFWEVHQLIPIKPPKPIKYIPST